MKKIFNLITIILLSMSFVYANSVQLEENPENVQTINPEKIIIKHNLQELQDQEGVHVNYYDEIKQYKQQKEQMEEKIKKEKEVKKTKFNQIFVSKMLNINNNELQIIGILNQSKQINIILWETQIFNPVCDHLLCSFKDNENNIFIFDKNNYNIRILQSVINK